MIISPDASIENVLLAETFAFNLLFIRQFAKMGLCTFFDVEMVTVMWSNTLKVAFVGHVEDDVCGGLFTSPHQNRHTSNG